RTMTTSLTVDDALAGNPAMLPRMMTSVVAGAAVPAAATRIVVEFPTTVGGSAAMVTFAGTFSAVIATSPVNNVRVSESAVVELVPWKTMRLSGFTERTTLARTTFTTRSVVAVVPSVALPRTVTV